MRGQSNRKERPLALLLIGADAGATLHPGTPSCLMQLYKWRGANEHPIPPPLGITRETSPSPDTLVGTIVSHAPCHPH